MPTICPRCMKYLSGPTGAAFCMFCGQRLDPPPAPPAGGDPDQTADMPTRGYSPTTAADPDEVPAAPPDRVGCYRLLRPLGAGGMGSVFEAESDDSGERVAVKLLSPKLAANPTSVERFRQEGRLASQISHPRCVFVYGADTDAGRPFIVMELMPGTTLKDVVEARGPLPVGEAVARMLDVIDGLTEAHRHGVIHRDVKPSNCFVTADDRVKVGDFGLSKSLDGSGGDKQLTSTGAFLGTVLFAPPEQMRGEEVGYDSDVYSVCATLYYLLTGQAPYQHESLTAALAKAISEPPPPIRARRADVPRVLERIVLRGMERDRGRRWGSLEELRDALTELLPANQIPARPRALIAAYLFDSIVLAFLIQLPIQLVESAVGGGWDIMLGFGSESDPGSWLGAVLYFAVLEGVYGTTAGKWLLRLRVTRVGLVGPPGLGPAAVRAVVFSLLWIGLTLFPGWLWQVRYVGPVLAIPVGLGCLAGLCYQLHPASGHRGLHDRASGCRVVQRPRPAHRVRLMARRRSPLDRPGPAASPLPPVVGGFAVRGKLLDLPGGAMVWVAEDRALGRRVLLWLRPATAVDDPALPTTVRPTRLRAVSAGDVLWNGRAYWWVGFVVPAGAPLPDVVDPLHPLPWADARYLLEQVVEELLAAAEDGTLPPRLGVDQFWVEPSGRVHLLDFPVPTRADVRPAGDAFGLVRQVATLLLEGEARDTGGRVNAPIPPHASRITDRLFAPREEGFGSVRAVHEALTQSHLYPPRVTGGMRAAHVGLTATLAGTGLIFMFAAALAYHFWGALIAAQQARAIRVVRAGLDDPATRAAWDRNRDVHDYLAPDRLDETRRRLERYEADQVREVEAIKRVLTRPERYVVERIVQFDAADGEKAGELPFPAVRQVLTAAQRPERYAKAVVEQREAVSSLAWRFIAFFTASYVVFALVFRGGLSFLLAGLTLVRRDGRKAGRVRCAVREALGWLPVAAMLLAVVAVQVLWPGWGFGRAAMAAASLAVLAGSVAIAIRFPERGPLDRIVGTYIVPV